MLKHVAADGRPNLRLRSGQALDRLKIRAGKRLLRSRPSLRLARALLPRRKTLKPHQRVELDFILELGERLYADHSTPVVWSNIFVPCELIWGLGLLPFYPETAAAIGAGLGLSPLGVEQAAALGYPVDLCTFHRSAAGLRAAGLYPRADLYVATSNLCDVTGQMLANFAHTAGTPFFFLDVPQSEACPESSRRAYPEHSRRACPEHDRRACPEHGRRACPEHGRRACPEHGRRACPEHGRRACPEHGRRDDAAVAYLTAQLQELVERLTAALGVPFEPERVRQAVRLSNQARVLALEVAALREAHPAPLRGSAMLDQLGMLTSMFGHPAGVAYYRALRDYTLDRIRRSEPEQANQKVRLYWMHLGPYFPAELCPHLEDDLGAVIAFEEASTVWWAKLDEEQPLRSLARKMLANYFNGPVERRVNLALRHIARYRCAGAVHFSHWGCRQSSGALRVIRDRLRKEGVPLLALDGDCVDPANLQLGPLRTRIEAFIEMLV